MKKKSNKKAKVHPSVREAKAYLRNYQALSAMNRDFCLPIQGVLNLLGQIIKAK